MAGISDDDALTCEDCGGELSFYQLGINFTNNDVVMQVGNEKRNVTEFVTKSSTQSGAKANAGVSSSGPKASGGGFVQNVNAVEDKDATSNAKSFSITQSSGYTVQLTWLNPENIDQSNYQFRSGCIDPDCPNSIINDINNRLKKSEAISQHIGNNSDVDSEQRHEMNDNKEFNDSIGTFLDGIESSNVSLDGIDPRDDSQYSGLTDNAVKKVKSGVGTVRSSTSNAVNRARVGVSNTATKVKGRFSNNDPVIKKDSDEPAPDQSTFSVSAGDDTNLDASFTEGEIDIGFDDGRAATDRTTIHVSPDSQDDLDVSYTPDELHTPLSGGDIQLSRGPDDNVEFLPGTDEERRFSLSDGSTIRVSSRDDVTLTMGDSQDKEASNDREDTPTNDPNVGNEPEKHPESDPNETHATERDTQSPTDPEERNVTETSTDGRQDAPDEPRPERDAEQPTATAPDRQFTETNPSVTDEPDIQSTDTTTDQEERGTDTGIKDWDEEPANTTESPDTSQTNDVLPDWDEEPASTTGSPDANQSSNGLPDWDEEPAGNTDGPKTKGTDTTPDGPEAANDNHDDNDRTPGH